MINSPSGPLDMMQFASLLGGDGGAMRTTPAQVAGAMSNSLAYRQIQQPPAPFDNQLLNMLFQLGAPVATQTAMGMSNPYFTPQLGRDTGAFDAYYSHYLTTPAYNTGIEQTRQITGARYGQAVSQFLDIMGMRDLFAPDVSSATWQRAGRNVGASGVGQVLTQMLDSFPIMQNLTGGSMMQGYDALQRAMPGMIRPAGVPLDLVDREGNINTTLAMQMGQHQAETWQALSSRMWKDNLTPNYEFTRGFDPQQIFELGDYMQAKNFKYQDQEGRLKEFRGGSVGIQTEMWEEQIGVLDAMRDIMGTGDLAELTGTLEQFTQGRAGQLNPERLRDVLTDMKATALILGVEGKEFMESALATQQAFGSAMGVAMTGSASGMRTSSGRLMGGIGGEGFAERTGERVMGIAELRGDMTEGAIQDITAEQAALFTVGAQSPQGRDILQIEWLRQQGLVDRRMYEEHQRAIASGDKQQQSAAAAAILRDSPWGSASAARSAMRDPQFRAALSQDLGEEGMLMFDDLLQQAQQREFPERMHEYSLDRLGTHVRGLQRLTGIKPAEYDAERVEAMAQSLVGRGREDLAGLVRSQFEEGGMSQVRGLMGMDEFEEYRGTMQRAGKRESLRRDLIRMDELGGQRGAGIRSGLTAAKRYTGSGASDETKQALKEAEKAANAGEWGRAQQLLDKVQADMGGPESTGVDRAVRRGEADYNRRKERADDMQESIRLQEHLIEFEEWRGRPATLEEATESMFGPKADMTVEEWEARQARTKAIMDEVAVAELESSAEGGVSAKSLRDQKRWTRTKELQKIEELRPFTVERIKKVRGSEDAAKDARNLMQRGIDALTYQGEWQDLLYMDEEFSYDPNSGDRLTTPEGTDMETEKAKKGSEKDVKRTEPPKEAKLTGKVSLETKEGTPLGLLDVGDAFLSLLGFK